MQATGSGFGISNPGLSHTKSAIIDTFIALSAWVSASQPSSGPCYSSQRHINQKIASAPELRAFLRQHFDKADIPTMREVKAKKWWDLAQEVVKGMSNWHSLPCLPVVHSD